MAVISRNLPTFTAVWNDKNIHLKEVDKTLCQKIMSAVWDLFSIIILPIGIARILGRMVHFTAKKLILPSAWFYPAQITKICKETFRGYCETLKPTFNIQK